MMLKEGDTIYYIPTGDSYKVVFFSNPGFIVDRKIEVYTYGDVFLLKEEGTLWAKYVDLENK